MKRIMETTVVLWMWVAGWPVGAQEMDFFGDSTQLSLAFERAAELKDLGEAGDSDARMAVGEARVGYRTRPWSVGETRMNVGLAVRADTLVFDDAGLEDMDAWSLGLSLTAMRRLNANWRLMGRLAPELATDFSQVDGDDMALSALMLAIWRISGSWTGAFGVGYSRDFGDDRLFPAAGAIWSFADEWQLRLVFPRPGLTWRPTDRLALSIGAFPSGGKWSIRDPREGVADREQYSLILSGWRLGGGVKYAFGNGLALEVDGGLAIRRRLVVENDDETLVDSDLAPTPGLRLSLSLKL